MLKNISIKVIDKKKQFIYGLPSALGEIRIGSFKEKFIMPLIGWTIKDYEKQWAEGIERIKHETKSCLIATMEDIEGRKIPLINWWLLYKKGNQIFIRNNLMFGSNYKKRVGNKIFNAETCYQFIPRRMMAKKGEPKSSEWVIAIDNND